MVLSLGEINKLRNNHIRMLLEHILSMTTSSADSGIHHLAPDLRDIGHGALPDLNNLRHRQYDTTYMSIEPSLQPDQLNIAGFDVRIGRLISWCDHMVSKISKKEMLEMPHKILDEQEHFVFEADPFGEKFYYVTSFEKINHSKDLEILVDSKSTTGRVGCMTHGAGLDSGDLITIVQPFSFPLEVVCGLTKLYQAAVRYKGTPYMNNQEILDSDQISIRGCKSLRKFLNSRGLLMTFDTGLAYKAKKCDIPINMDSVGTLDWRDYFEMMEGNSSLLLDKNNLYLLGSAGELRLKGVMGLLSREEEVMTGTGAWGHFAGIIQPYFSGQITMEFYSYSKRMLRKGDKAGIVIFDRVIGQEQKEDHTGFYQDQIAPRLPKMFKLD